MGIKLTTLYVGAGTCHVLQLEDHRTWLIDCGAEAGMDLGAKLKQMGVRSIEWLIVTNEDEDHLRGLECLKNHGLKPERWQYNSSINPERWVAAKGGEGSLTRSMGTWAEMRRNGVPLADGPRAPNVTLSTMFNNWNGLNNGLNNASLVVKLSIGKDRVIISGDMEVAGWEALRRSQNGAKLEEWLKSATIWVAAHHGRHNGYWTDGMALTSPEIVIISDKHIGHGTQEYMAGLYGKHARGAMVRSRNKSPFDFNNEEERWVLTTRKDGDIEVRWDRPLNLGSRQGDGFGTGFVAALNAMRMDRTIWIR